MKWEYYLANEDICLPIKRIEFSTRYESLGTMSPTRLIDLKIVIDNYKSVPVLPEGDVYLYDIKNDVITTLHIRRIDNIEMDEYSEFSINCCVNEIEIDKKIPSTLIQWIRDLKLEKLGI